MKKLIVAGTVSKNKGTGLIHFINSETKEVISKFKIL